MVILQKKFHRLLNSAASTAFIRPSRTTRSAWPAVIVPSFPESITETGIITITETISECFSCIPVPSARAATAPVIPAPASAIITASAPAVTSASTAISTAAIAATSIVSTTATIIPATHVEISFFAVCTVFYEQMQTRVTTLLSIIWWIPMHRCFCFHIRWY